ncbi:MAG TPA: flagellar FlbD family protein [Dehalococcoidia bacterium]
MIQLTRLDGSEFYLNSDLIEVIESTPDTHIALLNGHRYLVRESSQEVVRRVLAFRRAIQRQDRVGRSAASPSGRGARTP